MASDGRDRISDLYHRALERPPEERTAFLNAECDEDEALRKEVESLLGYESASARFLETPAVIVASGLAGTPNESPMIGRQLGPYAIVAPPGRRRHGRGLSRAR